MDIKQIHILLLCFQKKFLENVMTVGAIEQMDNMINGMNIATSFFRRHN